MDLDGWQGASFCPEMDQRKICFCLPPPMEGVTCVHRHAGNRSSPLLSPTEAGLPHCFHAFPSFLPQKDQTNLVEDFSGTWF